MGISGWKGITTALKRVCDITGTDSDVEICDAEIAGQAIRLDLSPTGAQKLREFFGSVVVVHHPADSTVVIEAQVPESPVSESQVPESVEDEQADASVAVDSVAVESAEPEAVSETVAKRPVRRGRKPAAVKAGRTKTAPRLGKPVAQDTSEIREWARTNGFEIGDRGAIPGRVRSAYALAHE